MKIGVITDSAANLTKTYIDTTKNLEMVPLLISVDGTYYRDQIEIDSETVYEKLPKADVLTSLPNVGDYLAAIEQFKAAGFTDILVITISSQLSGTYNSFRNANKDVAGINIHMYDTKTLSMAQGFLVVEAINLIKTSLEISEIIKKLDIIRFNDLYAIFTVETLKWLKKGGRIGKVEGTIGEILHLKPIISVDDTGVYHTVGKGFGMHRTILAVRKQLKERFKDDLIEIAIHYGNNLNHAEKIEAKLMTDLNVKSINITPLTPVLGVHVGPEIIAIIAKRV